MEEKFIQIFSGFSENYGQADMQRLEVDPISKKQKPEYRWAQQRLTDDDYKEHLTGTKSIGIQPCNEKNHAKFGAICLLYTSPSPRDRTRSRMPSSA